ncbi:hypothetical protein DL96DRAFT_1575767 [Flagelloscypha sp. PMI_526]|nr:hypothetical protein DL96DRAFT_1575767 [Flagelloscypha sp. PMI_526]
MMNPIVLPEGFHLILANLVATCILLQIQISISMKYRKKAGVSYPQLYANKEEQENNPAAFKFNCAQRIHQNTLENFPAIIVLSCVVGTTFPLAAAILGFVWNVGRVGYTYGYMKAPEKRNRYGGHLASFSGLGLVLTSSYVTGRWIAAELGF